MTVKDLLEKLKNMPEDAKVTLNCVYFNDVLSNVPVTVDAVEVLYNEYYNTVDLCSKDY